MRIEWVDGERELTENAEWLLLEDAIRVYSDPKLWAAYADAQRQSKTIPPQPSWIGSGSREWRDWQATYQGYGSSIRHAIATAERVLHKDFKDRLQAGTLVAVGTRDPVLPQSVPEPIAASLWDVLRLDVENNRVHTKGLTYSGVRICDGAKGQRLIAESANTSPLVARPPGRPSLNSAIRAELERRADSGEMLEEWRPEARALAAWVQVEYPNHKAPKFESIERQLREHYRQLKADKKPG